MMRQLTLFEQSKENSSAEERNAVYNEIYGIVSRLRKGSVVLWAMDAYISDEKVRSRNIQGYLVEQMLIEAWRIMSDSDKCIVLEEVKATLDQYESALRQSF